MIKIERYWVLVIPTISAASDRLDHPNNMAAMKGALTLRFGFN